MTVVIYVFMQIKNIKALFSESVAAKRSVAFLWFGISLIAAVLEVVKHTYNNYTIYKGVFLHTLAQVNLYNEYPAEYNDMNHYGPVFSMVIAPFALMPDAVGVVLWVMLNVWVLYKAVQMLPLNNGKKNGILIIGLVELITSVQNVQINPSITALLILSYVLIKKEKDFWACLFIALGFMVKLYGIIGLVFWVFSKQKIKFIGYFIFWSIVLFALPMIISSPQYVLQSYHDWYSSLVDKNIQNASIVPTNMQDISVPGMIKRISP